MKCTVCRKPSKKFGKTKAGRQRFRCTWCAATFVENHNPLGSMRVPEEKALLALQILVEGGGIRSAERITGVSPERIRALKDIDLPRRYPDRTFSENPASVARRLARWRAKAKAGRG